MRPLRCLSMGFSAAWVQYNLGNARFRIGAFSPPAGLEEVTSTNGSLFAERASPSELVRSIASGDGRTAAAIFANGERWQASVALSGNVIGTQTFDEQLGFVGRLSFVPYKREVDLLHLGVNTSIVINPAATGPDVAPGASTPIRLRDRPEMRVDGVRLVDTGNIDADGLTSFGFELGAQRANLALQAEYFDIRLQRRASSLDDPHFSGWYVQGSWTLTGEPRRYSIATGAFDSPRPVRPFNVKTGSWGAWELGLRYSDLDLNWLALSPSATVAQLTAAGSIRGGEQKTFTVGLNWYLNNVLRFQFAFQDVSVDRLSPGGTAFGTGSATPLVGTQVGQDLQIWSLRTQYAF